MPPPPAAASHDCPACGKTFASRHPRRSVLKHIQLSRKNGDPTHITYYNEASDIQKRRRKDEIECSTHIALRRQTNTENKRKQRLISKEEALNAVRNIQGEDLGNIHLYDISHQQSLFYTQKHRALKKARELSPPSAPTVYLPKLEDPSRRYLNPCLAIEVLLGIKISNTGFKGLQNSVLRYFNSSWNTMYLVSLVPNSQAPYHRKLIYLRLYLGNEDSNRRLQEPNSRH